MKLVVLGRGKGKTTNLINWLCGGEIVQAGPGRARWSRVLVVADQTRLVYIQKILRKRYHPSDEASAELLCDAVQTIAFFIQGLPYRPPPEIAIDELGDCLSALLGGAVEIATASPEALEVRKP